MHCLSTRDVTIARMMSLSIIVSLVTTVYLGIELCFYVLFHVYFVPRANQYTEPPSYRDYGRHRHKLLARILNRLQRQDSCCFCKLCTCCRCTLRLLDGFASSVAAVAVSEGGPGVIRRRTRFQGLWLVALRRRCRFDVLRPPLAKARV